MFVMCAFFFFSFSFFLLLQDIDRTKTQKEKKKLDQKKLLTRMFFYSWDAPCSLIHCFLGEIPRLFSLSPDFFFFFALHIIYFS